MHSVDGGRLPGEPRPKGRVKHPDFYALDVERRFGGATKSRKSAFREDLSQASFACLRSKGEANFLTKRSRSAYHRRESVINPANRVDILSERICRDGLHNHECAHGGDA